MTIKTGPKDIGIEESTITIWTNPVNFLWEDFLLYWLNNPISVEQVGLYLECGPNCLGNFFKIHKSQAHALCFPRPLSVSLQRDSLNHKWTNRSPCPVEGSLLWAVVQKKAGTSLCSGWESPENTHVHSSISASRLEQMQSDPQNFL